MDRRKLRSLLICSTVGFGCSSDGEQAPASSTTSTGAATETGSSTGSSTAEPTSSTSQTSTGGSTAGTTQDNPSSSSGVPAECEGDPIAGVGGVAIPLEDVEFRNAFDPTDPQSYDPRDAAALPGPVMADAWGDRSAGAHGTLAAFPPGFVAPLHTHSHAYDGVVLRGTMTNPFGVDLESLLDADPENDHGRTQLGPGSYWHVPAGSQHTTTCVGPEVCLFYFHAEDLFDFAPIVDENGALLRGVELERPSDDATLLPADALEFAGEPGSFVQFAPAWGDMAASAHGTFGLFDAGAASPVHVHSAAYYGVVIGGGLTNPFDFDGAPPTLQVGGYWEVPADSVHVTACEAGENCLFYFHAAEGFDFTPLCEQ